MYDHFDTSDPLDTKFLADMFIVQKEYRRAFIDPSKPEILNKENSLIIAKIEDCIDRL